MPLSARYTFKAIGTDWSIETRSALGESLRNTMQVLIRDYTATYSRFDQDSLVTQIAKQPGVYEFPDTADRIFSMYDKLYGLTDGKVSPTVGFLLEDLGYDASYSLQRRDMVRSAVTWTSVKRQGSRLVTEQPVLLDVGAAGKGYLADLIAGLLVQHGVDEFVVDASGDIVHHASAQDTIGLEDPRQPGTVIGTVELSGASLCASATNRRAWGDGLHHVVDPTTGQPTRGVLATWVIAPTGLEADALATALFFVDAETLSSFSFSYLTLLEDGSVRYDANGNWRLFS